MEKRCRFCGFPLRETFVDLGLSPLANSFVSTEDRDKKTCFYPLHVFVCTECFLVQLAQYETPAEIFSEYAYFSSYAESWLRHAREYTAAILKLLSLDDKALVVEIGSNDGYLLQYFKTAGISVLGIEPAGNVAAAAQQKDIPTLVRFFGLSLSAELADRGMQADLLIANNVLAHVPDLHDFAAGLKTLLKPHGVITLEFPHLLTLMQHNQFDTIYHEHFSYLSFRLVCNLCKAHGLRVFDVEELTTHGGSLRVYACHQGEARSINARVEALHNKEDAFGLGSLPVYHAFREKVMRLKRDILAFLLRAGQEGKSIAGYGAPAKGNTLLNYCGIRADLLAYTVDRNPHKQGMFLPGTHIPVAAPTQIFQTKPDYVLVLPWNLREEIAAQMRGIRAWGGKFVVFIPEVQVF